MIFSDIISKEDQLTVAIAKAEIALVTNRLIFSLPTKLDSFLLKEKLGRHSRRV